MKVLLLSLVLVSHTLYANEVKEIVEVEKEKVLIKVEDDFDEISLKIKNEECRGSLEDSVGEYKIIKFDQGTERNPKCLFDKKVNLTNFKLKKYPKSNLDGKWYNILSFGYIMSGLNDSKPRNYNETVFNGETFVTDTKYNLSANGYNISLSRYYKKDSLSAGFIYQVMRINSELDSKIESYYKNDQQNKTIKESNISYQHTNYLLGLSLRNDLNKNPKSQAYLKLDLGYNFNVKDGDLIANPSDDSLGSGFGFNIGLGFVLDDKIDFNIYHANRSTDDKIDALDDGLFIASLGLIF